MAVIGNPSPTLPTTVKRYPALAAAINRGSFPGVGTWVYSRRVASDDFGILTGGLLGWGCCRSGKNSGPGAGGAPDLAGVGLGNRAVLIVPGAGTKEWPPPHVFIA